jgi:outer membrane protein OmpA-like peptidoglycan-associated protein
MTTKGVLVAAILTLPSAVRAEPEPEPAAQFAHILTTSSGSDSKSDRAPELIEVSAAKAAPPTVRRSDAPKLGQGQHVAAPPTLDSASRVESHRARAVFLAAPVATGGAGRAATVGHPHRVKIASFEARAGSTTGRQLDELARSWKTNVKWHELTVNGYAAADGADTEKAGQRSADEVRAYLVRRGIPADLVRAIGHASERPGASAARIEITVTTCDDIAIACRQRGGAK